MKRRSCNQRGYVLVLSCLVLGLFLTFTAIALDLGHMYLWRLRLEKSVRAATLAGLGYRALRGWQAIYGGRPEYDGSTGPLTNTPPSGGRSATEWNRLSEHVRDVALENFGAFFTTGSAASDARSRVRFLNRDGQLSGANPAPDLYHPRDDSIEVGAEYSVPTFLVGRAAFLGITLGCRRGANDPAGFCLVSTEQRAQLKPATVAMILDTSGSMVCNDNDPTCACRTAPGGCGQAGTKRIVTHLKQAAITFQSFFNPVRDRIALVPFNLSARVARPILRPRCGTGTDAVRAFGDTQDAYREFIASILGGWPRNWSSLTLESHFLPGAMDRVNDECSNSFPVTGLEPMSNTNACDGFIQAGIHLNAVRNADAAAQNQSAISVVFFTDGAPNAMRGAFLGIDDRNRIRNPRAGGPISPTNNNDWYQYTVEWRDGGSVIRGPGPLVHAGDALNTSRLLFNFPIGSTTNNNPDTSNTTPRDAMICGSIQPLEVNFDRVNSRATPDPQACLQVTDFDLPGLPGASVRGVPHSVAYGARTLSSYDQLHYFCAIEGADWIRRNLQTTIYTVGLGSEFQDWCGDPAQDADNHFRRKDYFLARLAYTRNSTNDPATAWNTRYAFSPRSNRTINTAGDCAQHRFNTGGFAGGQMAFGYMRPGPGNSVVPADPPGAPNALRGQYFGTNTPADLPLLFTQIAKQILLRQDS